MTRSHRARRRPWPDSIAYTAQILVATLLILLGGVSAEADAEQTKIVGVVVAFLGPSSDYALRRGDAILPLRILGPVQAGDRIVVRHEDGRVWVQFTTGEERIIPRSLSDQPLEARGAPATIYDNLMASLAEPFTRRHNEEASNVAVRGRLRASTGQQLALPLVPERGAMIAAGQQREFTLAWLGGTPPFRVSLAGAARDKPIILETGDVFGRDLPPRKLVLLPGTYTLQILDSAGTRVERLLEAVPASIVPQAPPEPALAVLPPVWRVTAQTGWLAQQDGGRWSLEAFLQVMPLATSFEPARILANLLVQPAAP